MRSTQGRRAVIYLVIIVFVLLALAVVDRPRYSVVSTEIELSPTSQSNIEEVVEFWGGVEFQDPEIAELERRIRYLEEERPGLGTGDYPDMDFGTSGLGRGEYPDMDFGTSELGRGDDS